MRLLAISDLHLGHRLNREALATIGSFPDDWLIVAGDGSAILDRIHYRSYAGPYARASARSTHPAQHASGH